MPHSFLKLSTAFMVTATVCQIAAGGGSVSVTSGSFTSSIRLIPPPGETELPEACLAGGDTSFREFTGEGPHSVAECSGHGARVQLTTEITSSAVPNGTQFTVRFVGEARVVNPPAPPAGLTATVSANWDLILSITEPTAYEVGVSGNVGVGGDLGLFPNGGFNPLRTFGTLNPGDYEILVGGGANDFFISPDQPGHDPVANDTFTITLLDGPVLREFTWDGPPGSTYSEPTNWEPEQDAPPVHDGLSGDTAVFETLFDDDFNEITNYAVSAIGATAERFIIDEVSLDLIGNAQVFEPSSLNPSLTLIRGGRLVLENGARLSGVHGSIGFNPGLAGALAGLVISGGTSDCSFSGRLIIGEFSDGQLFLNDGATLSCDQAIIGDIAIGQASVLGAGSRWDANSLTVGAVSADGTLDVLESGRVEIVNQIVVGDFSTARLRLIDGGKAKAGQAVIGANVGGVGTIELNGDEGDENSLLEVNGALRVGVAGDGTLEIRQGSSVQANELQFAPAGVGGSATGQSHVVVAGTDINGAGSDLAVFTASRLSQGQLDVLDGARANFQDLSLGAGGTTEVDVRGFGDAENPARLITNRLTVGFDDFATLKVETGGEVTCTELAVNSLDTGGTGSIIVTEGIVTVDGTMRVSGDSQQTDNVIIETDGAITANALRLGDQSTFNSAEIVVRNGTPGGGSSLIILNGVDDSNGECSIGKDGPGVLRLENRGGAVATGLARVGGSPTGGAGFVDIGADCRLVAHDLDVGGASPGTIKLLTASSELIVTASAVVNNGGRVEGIGTFTGARFVNPGGFVSPGLSPGTLTINSNYEQGEGGTLIIEVAGLEPGQFDVLHVKGNAILAGRVDLKFIDGFVPQPGDSVDFLQVDGEMSGTLTGNTRVEAADGAMQADVVFETTPDGTLRMTVTDVRVAAAPAGLAPSARRGGMCGVAFVPMLAVTLLCMHVVRRTHTHTIPSERGSRGTRAT